MILEQFFKDNVNMVEPWSIYYILEVAIIV